MSRILFLSQLLPYPLDAGPKVRSYYVLRYLSQKHQVTLLAFTRPDDSQESVDHLHKFCKEIHLVPLRRSQIRNIFALISSLITGKSFIIKRDFIHEMAKTLDRLSKINEFDAVHADQLWMAQYALRIKNSLPNTMLVLDEHNACFQIPQRLAVGERNPVKRFLLKNEERKLRSYEARCCSLFNHVITVTQEDKKILQGLVKNQKGEKGQLDIIVEKNKFTTIPICIDTESTHPVRPTPGAFDVLHLGTMFWLPNIEGVKWFAREVWPLVVDQIPQATLTIAGKNPPTEIKTLSNGLNGKSTIQVTGYIPDPMPYLERAGVFIVPILSGGGMRVKIVDAWRWGLPIVSTTIGAEGLQCIPYENILIADNPDSFAKYVVQILSDPLLSRKLRENGRRWVEENYNWQSVYSAWDSIYIN